MLRQNVDIIGSLIFIGMILYSCYGYRLVMRQRTVNSAPSLVQFLVPNVMIAFIIVVGLSALGYAFMALMGPSFLFLSFQRRVRLICGLLLLVALLVSAFQFNQHKRKTF